MASRRVLSLLAVVLAATALTGCAGGDTLSLDPVAKAAAVTTKTTSSRFTFSASMDVANAGSMSFQGYGLYDGKARSGWMTMHFALPPQLQAQLGSVDPSMEMLFDGSHGLVMYMRSSLFDRQVPSGKWVKMDVASLARKAGVNANTLLNANQADPSQALRLLRASTGARATGHEVVRGVDTTRYAFRIDYRRLLEQNKALERFADIAGTSSIPAEAWIDSRGRVRKLTVTMSLGARLGTPVTMTMTEELYDFGVEANITPPPDDMVVDYTALAGSPS
jgi:predicted small lipoprotein YifL